MGIDSKICVYFGVTTPIIFVKINIQNHESHHIFHIRCGNIHKSNIKTKQNECPYQLYCVNAYIKELTNNEIISLKAFFMQIKFIDDSPSVLKKGMF